MNRGTNRELTATTYFVKSLTVLQSEPSYFPVYLWITEIKNFFIISTFMPFTKKRHESVSFLFLC